MGRESYRHLLEGSMREFGQRDVRQRDGCLLAPLAAQFRIVADSTSSDARERRQLCSLMERLLAQGYTLRSCLPGVPVDLQHEWLAQRLVLGHSRWFLAHCNWTSIVSSRLGRYGRLLADWPMLLELLLRSIRRAGSLYLAVPGTTIAPLVEPLLARSGVSHVRVRLPATDCVDVVDWLARELIAVQEGPRCDGELRLSPALDRASNPFEGWPLQDRIAMCCAQRVRVLFVRPRGTIAQLLERRLAEPRFTAGTVSVFVPGALESRSSNAAALRASRLTQLDWLQRGAVGWYVPARNSQPMELGCRQRSRPADGPLWQLTSNYALYYRKHAPPGVAQDDQRPLDLVHCVRGAQGVLPSDAAADFVARAWLAGQLADDLPLVTLVRILESAVLRGRAALNRTAQPCVSFSGVPLEELVARRRFQPHLGRWDWEPYGLIIRRQALEQLGARPVIYGDAEVFRQLGPADRPFFQPAKRRRHRPDSQRGDFQHSDWEAEREWRVLGDVRLSDLPPGAVGVFVAYAHQARALARFSRWPVIWLQDAQTHAPPTGSRRPRHKAVRTGRN